MAFLDGTVLNSQNNGSMIIEGLSVIDSNNPDRDIEQISNSNIQAQEFTHKIPVIIENEDGQKETYYLLLIKD